MKYFHLKIAPSNLYGCCNQIYSIAGMCSYLNEHKIKFLFLDLFLKQFKTDLRCPINQIIDLSATNLIVTPKYNVVLVDGHNFSFNIVDIQVYIKNRNLSLPTKYIDTFYINNNQEVFIPTTFYFPDKVGLLLQYNELFQDPTVMYVKDSTSMWIELHFYLNNVLYVEKYELKNGYLVEPIHIKLINQPFLPSLRYNDSSFIFHNSIRDIIFLKTFSNAANNILYSFLNEKKYDIRKPIHAIHLRLEPDAISHWSMENKCEEKVFKRMLEEKYIQLIQKYFSKTKNDLILILAHNYDNKVITYLQQNNYFFYTTPKVEMDRDLSAIVDLHIGQHANSIVIGNFETTFLTALSARIYNKAYFKLVMFEFNNLEKPELVYGYKINDANTLCVNA